LSDLRLACHHVLDHVATSHSPGAGRLGLIAEGLAELGDANLGSLSDPELVAARVELERISSGVTGGKLRATRRSTCAAAVVAETDRALASDATAAGRADAEHARDLDVRGLQPAALHLRHRLDPDQGERIAAEEEEQVARRQFRLRVNPTARHAPDGYLDKEATRPCGPRCSPSPERAAMTTAGETRATMRTARATRCSSSSSSRCELPVQAGQPVQALVAISLDDLQGRLARAGAGTLDLGGTISVEAVRRLACDAQAQPPTSTSPTCRTRRPGDPDQPRRSAPADVRCGLARHTPPRAGVVIPRLFRRAAHAWRRHVRHAAPSR
jgi:hypothetical protein